jgi:hypothetical protein
MEFSHISSGSTISYGAELAETIMRRGNGVTIRTHKHQATIITFNGSERKFSV